MVLVKRTIGIMCAKIAQTCLILLKLLTEDCTLIFSGHGVDCEKIVI